MIRLQRYLARSILGPIALMILLLLSLEFFFSMVNEMRQLGVGNYHFIEMLRFLALSLPSKLYQFFPMAVLVGTLMGLGVLASHGELVAMRAASLSLRLFLIGLLKVGLLLSVLVIGMGEWLAPLCDNLAQQYKTAALSAGKALYTQEGTWMRSNAEFVHIERSGHQQLEGIVRYRFGEQHQLLEASRAEWAEYVEDHWILHKVHRTYFDNHTTRVEQQEQERWDSDLSPAILQLSKVHYVDELSLSGLWKTIQFRKANGLDAAPHQLALWQKLLQPVSLLIMMFLSVPFIFGPLRHAAHGLRLVIGIGLGFLFHTLNAAIGPFILVYHGPVWLGALLPSALFLMLGIILFRRIF